ncbi:MAG: hypothetical protein QOJ07_3540 [Thermoleophilaceae bacterium]|jgi:hypothetical protein|nr:hypothetical protein [Thermoleophilaceae bacterium]
MRDGSFIFLGVMVVGFFGIVWGYFTALGSGINPRPYGKLYSGAPGANAPGEVSGHDPRLAPVREWSRGCR